VRYLQGYQLEIAFDDGSCKEIDLERELYGEVFAPLKNVELFKQVFVNPETRTLQWLGGADFAPEFLHEIGREVKQIA
jgi:hypothetical protein